jgi:hypothetical protein
MITFWLNDLVQELEGLQSVSGKFLSRQGGGVLKEAINRLDRFKSEKIPDNSFVWDIKDSPTQCITTEPSCSYEPCATGRKGGVSVHGLLSFTWGIRLSMENSKRNSPRKVHLVGNASIKLKILAEGEPLAAWQFEMGGYNQNRQEFDSSCPSPACRSSS